MSTLLNFTIDDSSPVFAYSPYADGSLLGGWQTWFSGIIGGFETEPSGGEESVGNSYHVTNFSGASAALQFRGTAIYLYGNASCTYTVDLDNTTSTYNQLSSSEILLFAAENLNDTLHVVNITALPANSGQGLAFDKAVITNVVPDQTTSFIVDNQNTSVLQYQGGWTIQSDPQVPDKEDPSPFHTSMTAGDSVSLNFTGVVAVAVNASTNYGHGPYNVTLDGVTSKYNGSTWWLVGNTMLAFQAGLDPSKPHTLEIVNAVSPYKLTLSSLTLYGSNISVGTVASTVDTNSMISSTSSTSSVSSTSPGSPSASSAAARRHTNAGVVAGPVVAVVALACMVLALLLWRRRVHARHNAESLPSPYAETTSVRQLPPPRTALEKLAQLSQSQQTPPSYSSSNLDDRGRAPGQTETGAIGGGARVASVPPNGLSTNENGNEAPVPAPSRPPAGEGVDINRIIELIVERIDRPSQQPSPGSDAPPPRYPESEV